MPYEGEFASYRSINRITQTARVQQLLKKSRVLSSDDQTAALEARAAPDRPKATPYFVVAIDGSYAEVSVKNGYPGARVGYVTVASVLLNLTELQRLDESRPVNPVDFREVEQAATVDAALPGSNVVTRDHLSARAAFREAVFDVFHDAQVDAEDSSTLLDTFQLLLNAKPPNHPQQCPYEGCEEKFSITPGTSSCTCKKRHRIYPTDALRIHERFTEDFGSNGEAFGLVMQIWERILIIHLLRCFENRKWLEGLSRLAFFVDGPLGVFGPPAWMSAAISTELKRLNTRVREATGDDLLLIGVEKSGAFVAHFDEIDQSETPGKVRFAPRSYMLLTDKYIRQRISISESDKRYGLDTYFGRNFFYKTASGARIVASLPFLTDEQDTLDTDDASLYPRFPHICAILDDLVSSRFPNSLSPIISAHSHAAIPLHLGTKVLQELAKRLMNRSGG